MTIQFLTAWVHIPVAFNIDSYVCFLGGSDGEQSACNAGNSGLIPGSAKSLGGGIGNPLQFSCMGNPMDRGAWWTIAHEVTRSQI